METVADQLNELDGVLGDGDLGVTMVRGARELKNELPSLPDDLGPALMQCARAFTKTSGSTFGTLIATGFMSAAVVAKGKTEVPWPELAGLLDAALQGMMRRGKAELGDKTALDAVDAIKRGVSEAATPAAMLAGASSALDKTMTELRGQPAKQGRARIFSDRSVGLDDPGMVVFREILAALAET
jgi:dihydroxyacetone kinase-like protein